MSQKNIRPHNDDNQEHGFWEVFYKNGELSYQCHHLNGDWVGYCVDYYNSKVVEKTFYLR